MPSTPLRYVGKIGFDEGFIRRKVGRPPKVA
jgi:hypothetical protein